MHKLFISLITILFFIGCDGLSEDLPISSHEQDMRMQQVEYTEMEAIAAHPQRSKEDAVKIAADVFLQDHPFTRAAQLCRDIKVDVLSFGDAQPTRGASTDGVDSSVFVCNLGDNNGFVLVSGDRRVPEMLAYVPEGYFDLDSISDNHPLLPFLDRLPGYFSESKAKFEKKKRRLSTSKHSIDCGVKRERLKPCPKEEPDGDPLYSNNYKEPIRWEEGCWQDEETPSRMLIKHLWTQVHPYNQFAPMIKGQRAVAGCVAVAVAQLMAFHQFPKEIDNKYIDWKLINSQRKSSGTQDAAYDKEVATLIYKVGMKLHNSWGVDKTGASYQGAVDMLKDCSYNVRYFMDYHENLIKASIKLRQPILACAYAAKTTTQTGFGIFKGKKDIYSSGHVWIIDGYLPQNKTDKLIGVTSHKVYNTKSEKRLLVHCNWGWGGSFNGFFNSGVFDATEGRFSDFDEDGERITRGNPEAKYYFQYKITILPFTIPWKKDYSFWL